jgi:valyl-tRNA synthetase
MRGFNVLLPQGWDTQGLPTELVVQKRFAFSQGNAEKFRSACKEWTKQMIRQMREAMLRLGYMPDWSFEYKTMDESYHCKVQLALLNLHKMGRIYRAKHPIHWCPKCKTALADAELGYKSEEGELAYIKFKVGKDFVELATTRPELLHACVALAFHPKDKRYLHLIGKEAQIPIYNRKVPIIADEAVDPEYGTGLVMICTFGDEQDVKTVLRHKLPEIEGIDDDGKIVNSGKYDGLTIKNARKAILEDLRNCGLLSKTVKITHNVLAHMERSTCQTPIEFLSKPQWFIRITDLKEEIIKLANQIEWFPPYMKNRLIDWVKGLEWDWLFSRQRVFGTPIPFWYCQKCNYIIAPKEEDLPIDPSRENPPINKCPKCESTTLLGAKDVCDCWVDSSITPLIISGWPVKLQYYPLDLRQQGSEIIRTWAFYSIIQCYLQTGKPPFNAVLVNGMILGPGGRAMSSSLGNTVEPAEVIEKYGADALRQGLLLASVGSDFPFEWKDIKYCYNFMQKFWNACRFAQKHLANYTMPKKPPKLHIIDKAILSFLQKLTNSLTEKMEAFQFNIVLQQLQEFVWHEFCDYYIENAKGRLYMPKKEWMEKSAKYALHTLIWTLARLYAPFAPHITEEISQTLFKKSALNNDWPKLNQDLIDINAEEAWTILKDVTSKIWKIKSQRRLPLNAEIQSITIRCKDENVKETLWKLKTEIKEVGKIKRLKILIDKHCPSLEIT